MFPTSQESKIDSLHFAKNSYVHQDPITAIKMCLICTARQGKVAYSLSLCLQYLLHKFQLPNNTRNPKRAVTA